MKTLKALVVALSTAAIVGNCYGSFSFTKRIYSWNGKLGSKVVNTIVMWGLFIIPVYGFAGIVDLVILNTLENLGVANPLAMAPGESETKIAKIEGKDFRITVSHNQIEIEPVDKSAPKTTLKFDEDTQSWIALTPQGARVIAQMKNDNTLELFKADGTSVLMPL